MRKEEGFTLIELLVVIAIIAVLMAILMPALNKARKQGQRVVCKSNLKNCTLAIYMYTGDNVSGPNDTYMIPCSDSMIEGWLKQAGSYQLIKPGPEGVGPFWDVIAGFHYTPSGDPMGGKGNCAFLDGHVDAYRRAETFPLAWPH